MLLSWEMHAQKIEEVNLPKIRVNSSDTIAIQQILKKRKYNKKTIKRGKVRMLLLCSYDSRITKRNYDCQVAEMGIAKN